MTVAAAKLGHGLGPQARGARSECGWPSSGAALLVAVEAAGLRHLDGCPVLRSLDLAWLGAVHDERAMTAPDGMISLSRPGRSMPTEAYPRAWCGSAGDAADRVIGGELVAQGEDLNLESDPFCGGWRGRR